jgi:hypothetical protein
MPFICFAVNSPHETLLIFSARYPADMGPLRHRVMKNTGIRSEPILETRVKEYTEFVSRDGIIGNSERVIVGVRGGGLAIIVSLPEVLEKKCTRQNTSYKIGDVIVIVDLLTRVMNEMNVLNPRPIGTADFIRSNEGKMLSRTILVSNIILPTNLVGLSRDNLLTYDLLGLDQRVFGLDVMRLQLTEIELIRERESELFSITDQ